MKNREKMLGMKNHFDISGSIEIREVDIAGVACICAYNYVEDPQMIQLLLYVDIAVGNSAFTSFNYRAW